jgi:hypothetical protein
MIRVNLRGKVARVVAAGAAVTIAATVLALPTGTASADPPEYNNAYAGVGSDTTQDVMNALSGFNQGTTYPRVFSDTINATTKVRSTIVSFDALPPGATAATDGCITTKLKSSTFARPNGSSSGARALSRSLLGGNFGPTPASNFTNCVEPGKSISNLVDFARSSSNGSGSAGTVLTYVPFARDALSFAYTRPVGSPETTFTTAELKAIYQNNDPINNPSLKNGKVIIPCGIQDKSGTYSSWNGKIGLTAPASPATLQTEEDLATTVCRGIPTATSDATTGRLQENYGQGFVDKAAGLASYDPDGAGPLPAGHFANAQLIIGFSASNYVSQFNGTVSSQLAGIELGATDANGVPYTKSGGVATSSASYFASAYGRDVYNVLSYQALINGGSLPLKEIFVTNPTAAPLGVGQLGRGLPANFTAVMCRTGAGSAQETVAKFGFLPIANCGLATTANSFGDRTGAF